MLGLPEEVLKLIEAKKLSPGHAKILVGLGNAEFVAKKILKKIYLSDKQKILLKFLKKKNNQLKKYKDVNLQSLETSVTLKK